MATNPKNIPSAVSLTDEQLATIAGGGSVVSGDDTYTADESTLYLTPDTSISYEAQTLTAEQQAQARQNIGAGTSSFDGAYSSLSGKPTLGTAAALNTGTSQGDIPLLGTNGKLPSSVVPASAITDTFVVASEAAMLALSSAEVGDVAVRTDLNKSFILKTEPYSTLANWQELLTPTGAVTSVNSQTGVVVLTASDVGAQSTIDSSHKLSADLVEDGTTNKVFTATEQSKLSGIASGAEVNVQANWNESDSSSDAYIQNKPTIPTVNDGTLTIQKNGTQVATFTANQSGNTTANIETLTYDEINPAGTINPFDDYYTKSQTVNLIGNPNLLINGDFRINQRGQNSYTGNTYGVDRWLGVQSSTIVTKISNGISVSLTAQYSKVRQLVQNYEYLKGKQVTISAKISNYVRNKTYHTVFEVNDGVNENIRVILSNGIITATGTINANATKLEVSFYNYSNDANTDTFDVEWAKLEVGSIATQFIPKSYEEELSLCQMPYPASVNDNGTAYSGSFVNPNLLINGDLSVNQRGQTTYSGANKYTADRWQQGSGTFDYSTKTWTPSTQYSGFVQKVEDVDKFKGQTVTISAKINSVSNTSGFDLLINDGSNHRSSITFTGAGVRSFTYTVSTTATQLRFGFIYLGTATTDTLSFEWVKVEMGEIATPFSPRPYAEELAMCQRYYIGSTVEAKALRLNTPAFMATSATQVYMLCKLPVTMRTTPTLIVNTLPTIRGSGINQTISNIGIFDAIRPDGIMFLVTSSGLTSYSPYALFNGYIQLDAEIY